MELDEIVGNHSPVFDRWVSRPLIDDYWAARVPSADELERLDLPILTITGYYDGDQPGAMQYYREHMRHGNDAAKEQHFLILGPWDHSGTRKPRQSFGGYEFGENMLFDAFALDRDWYRWTLGDGERPDFIRDRVGRRHFQSMSMTRWTRARQLEAPLTITSWTRPRRCTPTATA